jgi:ribosomal protein L11
MYISYKFKRERTFLKNIVYLQINSKAATAGPPIGPILGQCGIPSAVFCKDFNDRSSIFKTNTLIQVVLYIFINGEYNFDLKLPTNSFFLKKMVNLNYGLIHPGYVCSDRQELKNINIINKYRYVTPYLIYELLLYRYEHDMLSEINFLSNYRKIIGTIKSIGLLIDF